MISFPTTLFGICSIPLHPNIFSSPRCAQRPGTSWQGRTEVSVLGAVHVCRSRAGRFSKWVLISDRAHSYKTATARGSTRPRPQSFHCNITGTGTESTIRSSFMSIRIQASRDLVVKWWNLPCISITGILSVIVLQSVKVSRSRVCANVLSFMCASQASSI